MERIDIIHDSQSIEFREPFGAVKIGTEIKITLKTSRRCIPHINIINFYNNKIEITMKEANESYRGNLFSYQTLLDTKDLLGVNYYYFRIDIDGQTIFYGNNIECLGGIGQIYNYDPKLYQITVHNVTDIANWYKEGIIYQVFVDRFFNGTQDGKVLNPRKNTFIYGNWYDDPMYIKDTKGNIVRWDFYGGNLLGVRKKLDYIKSLGANIIYLNPIFESASCHKYDTADYENIDRMFGTNEDFKTLCEEADKIGIKIVLDGVFSHTGADSKYFNKYSKYNTIGAFQSLQSQYYSWYKFNDYPKAYHCWWGFSNMPEVDELNPSYLDYIVRGENSIVEKWLKLGASGWRLDVADELPDKFIRLLRQKLKETKPDGILIGEVWEDASNKVSYSRKREYLFGNELDSVTNYPVRQIILDYVRRFISAEYFIRKYKSLLENYPRESFYSTMNLIGNHDTERVLTMIGNNLDLLKIVVSIQMTIPGVPLIYYGDETGLMGGRDPENRKPYPWGREKSEILDFYKSMTRIRCNEEALKRGDIKFRESKNNILCYERISETEKIIVIMNVSEKSENYILNNIKGKLYDLICEEYYLTEDEIEIKLNSNECKMFKVM